MQGHAVDPGMGPRRQGLDRPTAGDASTKGLHQPLDDRSVVERLELRRDRLDVQLLDSAIPQAPSSPGLGDALGAMLQERERSLRLAALVITDGQVHAPADEAQDSHPVPDGVLDLALDPAPVGRVWRVAISTYGAASIVACHWYDPPIRSTMSSHNAGHPGRSTTI